MIIIVVEIEMTISKNEARNNVGKNNTTWTPKVCKITAKIHQKWPKGHYSTYSWGVQVGTSSSTQESLELAETRSPGSQAACCCDHRGGGDPAARGLCNIAKRHHPKSPKCHHMGFLWCLYSES